MAQRDGLTPVQDAVLRQLSAEGVLSAEQEAAIRKAFAGTAAARRAPSGWLVELAGYLGGTLLLGAAGLFLAASWDTMTRPVRGLLLAGFAAAFVAAAVVVGGGPAAVRHLADGHHPARRRLAGLLFGLACVPAGAAVGVVVDWHPGPAGTAVAFAVAVAGFLVLPTVFGALAMIGTSWYTMMAVFDDWNLTPLALALLALILAAAWCVLALTGLVGPRRVVLALGIVIAVFGAQVPLGQSGAQAWAYGLTAAVALACFLLYRLFPDVVLFIGGVLAATIVVPEAVADVTNGALGGSAILLTAGLILLGLSAVGLRLRSGGGNRHRTA